MAKVFTPSMLRASLKGLRAARADLRDRENELNQRIGETLVEVQEMPGLTLTEAAQLLGISKPTAYKLLEAAS